MANYDWTEYRERSWDNRYPEGVRGLAAWRQQMLREGSPESAHRGARQKHGSSPETLSVRLASTSGR
jgi:hypothetical protein